MFGAETQTIQTLREILGNLLSRREASCTAADGSTLLTLRQCNTAFSRLV